MSLEKLREIDAKTKPPNAELDWIMAANYYEDSSRLHTIEANKNLGVGLRSNDRPLELNLIRRIIDRQAVCYKSAPTRWLSAGATRLDDSDPTMVLLAQTLRRMQYDLGWRRADRLTTLHRQVAIRWYPSPSRRAVVMRVFEPYNFMRETDPSAADDVSADARFALLLSKIGAVETWEYWERTLDGWLMSLVDEKGALLADQPFALTGGVVPYQQPPVQMLYDEVPQGRAWLPPRGSRLAWARATNAMTEDLWALVVSQAHSERVLKTDDPGSAPTTTGPNTLMRLEREDDYQLVSGNPKISESREVLADLLRFWAVSEDLPSSEWDKNKTILTGVALMVQERPLDSRREERLPMAAENESLAFRLWRPVHNVNAFSWNVPSLPDDLELGVQLGSTKAPVNQRELQESSFGEIAIGAASVIDYLMAARGMNRADAIKEYERVQIDLDKYPTVKNPGMFASTGPKLAGVGASPEPLDSAPSVVHAINNR